MTTNNYQTEQLTMWMGKFGKDYTERNTMTIAEFDEALKKKIGVTKSEIFAELFSGLTNISRILEVGCNIGNNVRLISQMGEWEVYGLEPQANAIDFAREHDRKNHYFPGNAFDIPFRDGYFDVVFTAGVLIHISPKDLTKALGEIIRVCGRYIMGYEYFSNQNQEIAYHGQLGLLWKRNFAQTFLDVDPRLKLINDLRYPYFSEADRKQGLMNQVYLIEIL